VPRTLLQGINRPQTTEEANASPRLPRPSLRLGLHRLRTQSGAVPPGTLCRAPTTTRRPSPADGTAEEEAPAPRRIAAGGLRRDVPSLAASPEAPCDDRAAKGLNGQHAAWLRTPPSSSRRRPRCWPVLGRCWQMNLKPAQPQASPGRQSLQPCQQDHTKTLQSSHKEHSHPVQTTTATKPNPSPAKVSTSGRCTREALLRV